MDRWIRERIIRNGVPSTTVRKKSISVLKKQKPRVQQDGSGPANLLLRLKAAQARGDRLEIIHGRDDDEFTRCACSELNTVRALRIE